MLTTFWGRSGILTTKMFLDYRPAFCIITPKGLIMEKKVFGVILTILGIAGLIAAAMNFVNSSGSNYNVKLITVYGILGLIFFFSGIGLMKTTRDKSA